MAVVAVTDHVFPDLDQERAILAEVGHGPLHLLLGLEQDLVDAHALPHARDGKPILVPTRSPRRSRVRLPFAAMSNTIPRRAWARLRAWAMVAADLPRLEHQTLSDSMVVRQLSMIVNQ